MRVSHLGRADHAEWRWRAKDERWDWRGRLGPERRARRAWPKSLDFTLWAMRKSLGVLSRGRWCNQIYIFARWFQLLGGECTGKGSNRTVAKMEATGLGAPSRVGRKGGIRDSLLTRAWGALIPDKKPVRMQEAEKLKAFPESHKLLDGRPKPET